MFTRMFQRRRLATRRRTPGGFTLVEMMISTVVLAILLESLLHGAVYMTQSTESGSRHIQLVSQMQMTLDKMHAEINASSTDFDPATGIPYMSVAGVPNAQSLTFQRVVNYSSDGIEMTPIWSTPITYDLQNGNLMRTQNGTAAILLRNVTQLNFTPEPNGRVLVAIAVQAAADKGVAAETIFLQVPMPTAF